MILKTTNQMNKTRRNKRVYELSLTAFCLAISIICLSLSYVFSLSFILIILFIPFLNCLLALKTSIKVQLIYFVALFILTPIDYISFLFYMLPNTLLGLVYGNLFKKNVNYSVILTTNMMISSLLNIVSIFVIKYFFLIDTYEIFATMLSIDHYVAINVTNLLMVFLSIVNVYVIYFVIESNITKFTNLCKRKTSNKLSIIFNIVLGFILFTILFSTFTTFEYVSVICSAFIIYLTVVMFLNMLNKKRDIIISVISLLICLPVSNITLISFDKSLFYMIIPFSLFGIYLTYTISRIVYLTINNKKNCY